MIEWVIKEFELLKNKLEEEAKTAWNFMASFFKEAISEEEAALFPAFKSQVVQLLSDEAAIQGLNLDARVALAIKEATADLATDLVIAKKAMFHSWAWAIAHKRGEIDGNQGSSSTGDFSGNTDGASNPVTP